MRTAIVLLNWNGRKLLEKFLPGVIAHADGAEVVVADNASTDDSVPFIEKHFPDLRIIRLKENMGFAGGYNKVLAQIEASYYVLLNTDVEVTPGWLTPLIEWMEAHPETAACQPAIRSYDRKDHFEHAGAAGGYIDKYGYPFCRGRLFNTLEKDEGQHATEREIFWATGACAVVRAHAFRESGGFDEAFFAHMEEIDLCWRFRRAGHQVWCLPGTVVYHVGGATLDSGNPRKTYLNFRNNLMMLHKNLPSQRLAGVLAYRFIWDAVAAVKFFSDGDTGDARAVIRAWTWFLRHRKERRVVRRAVTDRFGAGCIYQGSVVSEYYFKGCRRFSELKGSFS